MLSVASEKHGKRYTPLIIIHGGAGAIRRESLPPELYKRYHRSLMRYLVSARKLLDNGSSALDAACHAVSLLEDDKLFNCGRGAVFTEDGTIELEASVMVASISQSGPPKGSIKRTGAVSKVRNTRHPIQLAREVLLDADSDGGVRGSGMHCHLNGRQVEEWGWNEKGLEWKDDDWFWTQNRWEEHRRGLKNMEANTSSSFFDDAALPSQGTVGAVCLDVYGNVAVATSTGGLTNKATGRVGDTPTVGAGFWADSWSRPGEGAAVVPHRDGLASVTSTSRAWIEAAQSHIMSVLADCLPAVVPQQPLYVRVPPITQPSESRAPQMPPTSQKRAQSSHLRTLVAMSGTGNGDSFLRVAAARSAAAMCQYSRPPVPLREAVRAVAGPGGELQRSAGDRWMRTGEGQGGIIGIELSERSGAGSKSDTLSAEVVFDFNCGGMWRAWYAVDRVTGEETPKVMVFRDEYRSA